MHRASGPWPRRAFRYLLPLAVLTVIGLVFGRSLLSSSPDTGLASGFYNPTKPATATTAAPTGVANEAAVSPAPDPNVAKVEKQAKKAARLVATTSTQQVKDAKAKKAAKATSAPTAKSGNSGNGDSADGDDGNGDGSSGDDDGGGGTAAPAADSGFAGEVLSLVNAEREKADCEPLTLNSKLNNAAQGHSTDMATQNYFSHTSQDGRTAFDRIRAAGYSFSAAAENIAAGGTTAAGAMDQWMNSAGHKANILNCTYAELGVGYAKGVDAQYAGYWTQNFGTAL